MKVFHEAAMSSDGISQKSTLGGGMIKLSLFQNVTSSNMDVLKLYDIILLGYTQSFAAKGKWCEKKYLRYLVFLVSTWFDGFTAIPFNGFLSLIWLVKELISF